MINENSLRALAEARWQGVPEDGFVAPCYADYSFARLNPLLRHLVLGEGEMPMPADVLPGALPAPPVVVLVWVDALGWCFVAPRLGRDPFLRRAEAEGVISQISALFPSTTAVHFTALHTGLPPAQSGIYEWFQYEPRLRRMIAPLLFSFAGDAERGTLLQQGFAPDDLFPTDRLAARLHQAGAEAYFLNLKSIAASKLNQALMQPARSVSFSTLAEACVLAGECATRLRREGRPGLVFLYYPMVDGLAHEHGPDAPAVQAEVDATLWALERVLVPALAGQRVLLLITADHGVVDVQQTHYLNQLISEFSAWLETGADGRPLTPEGSPRDFFLRVRPQHLEEAQHRIAALLGERAVVMPVTPLIAQGYFGSQPSPQFLERVGSLVVLPRAGEAAYYYEKDRFEQRYRGHHGGLTAAEMRVPLITLLP